MKKVDPVSISEVIKNWFNEEPIFEEKYQEIDIINYVYNTYASIRPHISDCNIKHSVLTIRTKSSVVRNHLFNIKSELIDNINKEFGYNSIISINIY